MRVLVTGASGFVGQAVLAALLQRNIETIAVSRRRPAAPGDYIWQGADLLDPVATARLIETVRPDAILHLAWTVEHGKFWTDPANLDWVGATLRLARIAREAGVPRFVGTGTCYEYDWPLDGPCVENATPLKPALLYGIAKDATRRVLEAFAAGSELSFAWARLFFLYGPGEGATRLVPAVSRALARGEPAACTRGAIRRDFMDVRDAAEALVELTLSGVTGPVNIATGHATSIADIALALGALAGRPDLIRLGAYPDRPGEPPLIAADVTRLGLEVGHRTSRALETGLKQALAYWTRVESAKAVARSDKEAT